MFMGTVRWSDPHQRLQYGVAFPVALGHGPSVGVLLQLQMRLGD
jgi:hypothetical protein